MAVMAKMLILYSTTDGHTQAICQKIHSIAEKQGHQVTLLSIDDPSQPNPSLFDKIVIGASIRYGKHRKSVYDYIKRHQANLDSKPSAFFSVNAVARKPEKNQPHTNPYCRKFLQEISWQPNETAVFGGEIAYHKYGFLDRWMIRLIMYITHGPTDLDSVTDFTDWDRVDAFANTISHM
jgi:menaquinone-dependent protoporphyrinogen oxidase